MPESPRSRREGRSTSATGSTSGARSLGRKNATPVLHVLESHDVTPMPAESPTPLDVTPIPGETAAEYLTMVELIPHLVQLAPPSGANKVRIKDNFG